MNQNPWDSLKPPSPSELARLGELVSRPIIEPPWVDVGNAAYGYDWPVTEEDQKLLTSSKDRREEQ